MRVTQHTITCSSQWGITRKQHQTPHLGLQTGFFFFFLCQFSWPESVFSIWIESFVAMAAVDMAKQVDMFRRERRRIWYDDSWKKKRNPVEIELQSRKHLIRNVTAIAIYFSTSGLYGSNWQSCDFKASSLNVLAVSKISVGTTSGFFFHTLNHCTYVRKWWAFFFFYWVSFWKLSIFLQYEVKLCQSFAVAVSISLKC